MSEEHEAYGDILYRVENDKFTLILDQDGKVVYSCEKGPKPSQRCFWCGHDVHKCFCWQGSS